MSPTKVNGISLHFASIDQQFLTDFPETMRTMARGREVGREQGEENNHQIVGTVCWNLASSLANPKCPWVES